MGGCGGRGGRVEGRVQKDKSVAAITDATLIPLFSSSEHTGCGYPGLLDRKNRSDMCRRWETNPRLPAWTANTLSTLCVKLCVYVYSNFRNDVPRVAQRHGTIAAHTRRLASVPHRICSVLRARVQFCRFDKANATADVK